MKKEIVSIMTALLLVAGLHSSAYAENYYLDDGDIKVEVKDDGKQYVTQSGGTEHEETSETIIMQGKDNTTTSSTDTTDLSDSTTDPTKVENVDNSVETKKETEDNITNAVKEEENDKVNTVADGANEVVTNIETTTVTATTPTTHTVTITVAENQTANVTLKGLNIQSDTTKTLNGDATAAVTINAGTGATANVTLDSVNIDVSGTGSSSAGGAAALSTEGAGDVNIELDGKNTLKSSYNRAGLEKSTDGSSTLTIKDGNGISGSLTATGGSNGAGIGGGNAESVSNITITGGTVTANGGMFGTNDTKYSAGAGAGIGGGKGGDGKSITISGGKVQAVGGAVNLIYTFGTGSASKIYKVTTYYTGIGGGTGGTGSNIAVEGTNTKVDAVGGFGKDEEEKSLVPKTCGLYGGYVSAYNNLDDYTNGAAYMQRVGKPGGNHDGYITSVAEKAATCTEGGYTYSSTCSLCGNVFAAQTAIPAKGHDYTSEVTKEATCTANGERTYTCSHGDSTYTEEIPATGHNYGEWSVTTPATCTKKGTETHKCTNANCSEAETREIAKTAHTLETVDGKAATCKETGLTDGAKCLVCGEVVVEQKAIPATGNHTWDSGKVTTEPTTESTGVKTYTCEVCHETKTEVIPKLDPVKPGTDDKDDGKTDDGKTDSDKTDGGKTDGGKTNVNANTNTVAYAGQYSFAALYRVTNEGNYDTEHTAVLKNGVLTITAEKDFASLKGHLWGIKVLMSYGVEKIVFVTSGATSTFVLADLLAEGGASDGYVLTHDDANVTFTFGSGNADISSILQS